MLHHPHHLTVRKVKVMDFEILCIWLKFLEVDISWNFNWIYLMLDIGLKFNALPI